MRTSTSRRTGSCGRPSGRPASAAPPASRVIVERSVVEPLLQRLESRAQKLRLGSGLDPAVDVGPLINAGAADKVSAYVNIGRGEAELVLGGGRAAKGDLAHGHFFEPTIFAGVGAMDRIGQEEIFGPVLSVIPVDDYGSAMLALNQTRYGLSSSIFTRDVNQAFRAMRDFETGIVYVNAGTTGAEATCRSAAGRRPATATARRATSRSTPTPSGSRSTSTSPGGLQRAQIDNQPG